MKFFAKRILNFPANFYLQRMLCFLLIPVFSVEPSYLERTNKTKSGCVISSLRQLNSLLWKQLS